MVEILNGIPHVEKLAQYWKDRMTQQEATLSGDDKAHLIQDVERLVQLYEKIGKSDKVVEWQDELNRWQSATK